MIDPLLERQEKAIPTKGLGSLTPDLNFEGQGFSGVNPPDPSGDIGPSYYIQMINHSQGSVLSIYDKVDGDLEAGPMFLDQLGSGNCASGLGDPIVLYDRMAERWLLSEFSSSGNRLCVYISRTNDPIDGGWYNYDFAAPSFPDYPKYAVWPDAYYVTSNESSPVAYALDRVNMLSGGVARPFVRMTFPELGGFGFQTLTPADFDGPMNPALGAPIPIMRHNDDEAHNPGGADSKQDLLEIWSFSVDFDTPANSTLTGPLNVPITEIDSDLCGLLSFSCVPQPSGSNPLDPLREVVMWRLQYRNFGSHEALIGNLTTDIDGQDHAGIRWFEIRRSGGGSWQLFQEGTYSPDTDHRFMGSVAMDVNGNIALAYSVSSSSTEPSLRYAGRFSADMAGTLSQGEASIVAGTASNSSNRYGDYSSMTVDPVDDCTFWFTGEYNPSTTWSTRIASFRFDDCEACEPLADAEAGDDRLICLGESIVLGDTAQPDTTYLWAPSGEDTAQITVSPTGETEYMLTATTACGNSTDSVRILVDDGSVSGLNDDFESGIDGWTATGLWHMVDDSACATPGYASASQAMYFGQDEDCTYSTGGAASGELISPIIFGIDETSTLSFDYFRNAEFFDGGSYDKAEVAVSQADSGAWTTVWSKDSQDVSENAWTASGPIALDAFTGQAIRVRFRFDSIDGSFNNFTGWFIDDVEVTGNSSCNTAPTLDLLPLEDPMTVLEGTSVDLVATALDLQDGDLTSTIEWSSNLDGILGTGGSISTQLSVGTHLITARVVDSIMAEASVSLTVQVLSISIFEDGFEEGSLVLWTNARP